MTSFGTIVTALIGALVATHGSAAHAVDGTCSSPYIVPAAGGAFDGTTIGKPHLHHAGGSQCAGDLGDASPEVVFQWVPAASGTAVVRTCSATKTDFDTIIYVRQGQCGNDNAPDQCNDNDQPKKEAQVCKKKLAPDQEGPEGGASYLEFRVNEGETYWIFVDGQQGASGDFWLTVSPPNVPAGVDHGATACDGAISLPPEGGVFTGTTTGRSTLKVKADMASPAHCGSAVLGTELAPETVFRWVPDTTGDATVETCSTLGTDFDTIVYVLPDTCAPDMTPLICNEDDERVPHMCGITTDIHPDGSGDPHRGSRAPFHADAGRTYYVVVDGYGGASGEFVLTVTPPGVTTTTTIAPAGTTTTTLASTTTCAHARSIPASGGAFFGTTNGASDENQPLPIDGCGPSIGDAPEAVYRWVPAVSGSVSVKTCSRRTNFDTVLYVRHAACDDASTQVPMACDDDDGGCARLSKPEDTDSGAAYDASAITFDVVAGETYFIFVDGKASHTGDFLLTVTPHGVVTGCDAVTKLPPEGGIFTGTTSGDTPDSLDESVFRTETVGGPSGLEVDGNGACRANGTALAPDKTFAWTPPRAGMATVETCSMIGTDFDTVAYVLTGDCKSATEQVPCLDDSPPPACGISTEPPNSVSGPHRGSRLSFSVKEGENYYIVVDGSGGTGGEFRLAVIPPGPFCGNGVTETTDQKTEDCDEGAANGDSSCCTTGCTIRGKDSLCRPARNSTCDIAEVCDGTSPKCPADRVEDTTTLCGLQTPCTLVDHCEGGVCVKGVPLCGIAAGQPCYAKGIPCGGKHPLPRIDLVCTVDRAKLPGGSAGGRCSGVAFERKPSAAAKKNKNVTHDQGSVDAYVCTPIPAGGPDCIAAHAGQARLTAPEARKLQKHGSVVVPMQLTTKFQHLLATAGVLGADVCGTLQLKDKTVINFVCSADLTRPNASRHRRQS